LGERIVLVNPAYSDSSRMIKKSAWIAMPIGLLYLAAILEEHGHYVKIIDMEATRLTNSDIKTIIEKDNPSFVGITATTPIIKKSLELSRIVKKVNKGIKVLLGGPHPTYMPIETLDNDSVDIVVFGEGEITICEVIHALSKDNDTLEHVKGVYFKKNGKIVFTGEREPIPDLDILPFPAWHLIDINAYRHPLSCSGRVASVFTSRGCPFRCTFCSRGVFGHRYRKRSTKNILDEIQILIERYNIEEVHFIDDTLTLNRSHIEEICRGIINRGWDFKWATPNGVNINSLDFNLLNLMKEAGCYSLSFGVESGNQETLDRIKKNQSLEEIKEIFNICHKIGLETIAFIIIGFPNEDRIKIRQTLKFLEEIKADVADIHMLIPLPGTELYDELNAKGYIIERDWSKYVFHNLAVYKTDYFSQEEIFKEYKHLYLAYHLRPAYIFSRLRNIKSLRDIKNNINGFITLLTMKS